MKNIQKKARENGILSNLIQINILLFTINIVASTYSIMTVSIRILVTSLVTIFLIHKFLLDFSVPQLDTSYNNVDTSYNNDVHIHNDYKIPTKPQTEPLTETEMKDALQQYLDRHLQQHTPQEPTLQAQYNIMYEHRENTEDDTLQKKGSPSPPFVLEELNSNDTIQPFMMNDCYFAAL